MRNNTLRLLALSFLGLSLFSNYASGMNNDQLRRMKQGDILANSTQIKQYQTDHPDEYKKLPKAKRDKIATLLEDEKLVETAHRGKGVTNSSSKSKKEQRKDENKDDNNGGGDDGQPAGELSSVLQKWGKGEAVTEFADVRGLFRNGYNQVNLDALKQGAYVQKGEDATGKGKGKAGKIDPAKDLKEDAVFTVYGAGDKLLNKPLASFVCSDNYTKDNLDDLRETAWTLKVNGKAGDAAEPYELFVALLKEYIKGD